MVTSPFLYKIQKMEHSRSIKNRLFQTLGNRSPKQAFLLQDGQGGLLAPILKPKKSQETLTPSNARNMPMYKSGKLLLNPLPTPEAVRKRPKEVKEEKLSRQAKSMVEQGKNRLRTNLKPHDIFQLYESFPEMLEDFFYLNRATHPYDYQIVTYAQRNPMEYMTISSQGVTLYHDKQAEFLTREQWLIDEKRYYQLQRIYFFKQYKLSKNFRIWKNKMRRHYMREMSGILSEHLFLTVKYPRNCLLAVRHHTNALRDSLSFFPYDTMEKLGEREFEALMVEYRNSVLLKGIKQITNQITSALEEAVAEQINKFKLQNNIKIDGVNQCSTNKEGYVYSQQAILRKQYKRVYKLIKLADSMLQQAKIEMVIKCLHQLLDRIKELQAEDKQPWVTCVATVAEDGSITWQPDCPALCGLFLRAISSHILAISDHNEKIVQRESFSKYRLADSVEGKSEQGRGTFRMMIEQSPQYSTLMEKISTILTDQFQQTGKQEILLQQFIDIYLRHRSLSTIASIFSENNGVQLCNYVEEWKRDEKDMHELTQDKRGRLILYNFADLRRKIVGVPRHTLSCFLSLLPDQTLTRCRDLIGQSRALFQLISLYPTEIVSFARFNRAVKQASQRLQDIRSAGSQICLLIDLMAKNKMSNIQLYNSKKIEALNSITLLKNKVDESEAKENQSLSKFKKDNQAEVTKIKTVIKDLAGKFNTIDFNQTKVTAKEMKDILTKIREILPAISALEAQSRKIQQIQVQLNLIQTDFAEVHQLYQNAKLVHDIWSTRDDWKSTLVNLYRKHYCDVDTAELKQNWQQFSNKINRMGKLLPQNQILKNLMQELLEVEVLIDTIIALRSPNLEEKAWRQISEYLAYQLGLENDAQLPFSDIRNPLYTVRWLLQINIPMYKQKIQFIVRKSQKQRELGVHLSEYKTYIANIAFDLTSKKREVYVFAENAEIQEKVHLYLEQLYSMLDNQYSQSIKIQAQNLIRHYEYVEQIIKAVIQFGAIWSRYESFFDGNSNSLKMLTKQSKEFFSWQTQWKKVIKNITTDAMLFYKKVCDETTGVNCSRSMMKQIAKINITIEQVKKGLDEYLEKKRAVFPRYFFIPDEQLLKMLSTVDSKEPITQSFVPILYKNIEKILYKQDTKDTLLGIISKQGQEFPLKNVSFKLQSQMEQIFKQTEQQIKKRMGYLIKTIFVKYIDEEITRQNMIMDNNAQVVLAIDAIAWVRLAQETYLCPQPIGDLYDWIQIQQAQIRQLKSLLQISPKNDHIKYKLIQLMSQSIYQLQKTEYLLKQNITSTECYEWQRMPKLCMNNNNSEIYLRQLNNRLNYSYEFLSNKSVSFVMPNSERAWINIAQAISNKEVVCLEQHKQGQIQTVKELGYIIAQDVETVHMSESISFKNIERFISGALFTGSWICMNLPSNEQVLSFFAHQVNHIRKAMLDPNLEKSKTQFVNSNVAFFLNLNNNHCPLDNVSPSLLHRNVTISKPSFSKILGIISDCICNIPELGIKVIDICELMNDTFKQSFFKLFTKESCNDILQKAISMLPHYEWLKKLKCKQYYEYVICEALDSFILPLLKKEDIKVYDNLKSCIVPDYQKIKVRHPSPKVENSASVAKFLDENKLPFLKKGDFIESFEIFEKAVTSNSLGVILYGEPLSGKSTLINLASKKMEQSLNKKIKMHRMYHKAYNKQEIFSSQKTSNIFTEILNDSSSTNWIIFDGALSLEYLEIFGSEADRYLIPQIGAFPSKNRKFKFICETYDISTLSPSVIGSHSLVFMGDVLSTENIIRKFFAGLQSKRFLSNLQAETVKWLISGFISILTKLQSKSLMKSKQINLIYPLSQYQITQRCCRTIQAIFTLNWQSIRQKQKNMRKFVERFVAWSAYWSLLGVVFVEDELKLQKFINEIYRSDANSAEELSSSIIYPGCGLEVQPINGLRTQSSLQIPEKGIITNLMRSDLVSQMDQQKGNKFYEQIVISQPQVIRVNYLQSNKYNYISQLSHLTDTPVFLVGSPNTGKKSIVQLFAKNMRNKSQYYSIRYRNREFLSSQIQKPFRKLIALSGIIMKSVSASKRLIISIEDVSLNSEHRQTSELLRMIFNQKGYYNKQAQWMRFSNCCFNLIASKFNTNTDNLRLLSKMTVFQTSSAITDKVHAIYSPYLKNWSAFNGLTGEVQRIFTSQNGDTLLDATFAIYKLMDELHKNQEKGTLEKLLLRPRIGDITKVLTYICKTPEANHYNLTYYYELWTHEIVRVFGDRLSTNRQRQQLFKEIKKEALVKFKENFTLSYSTMFNFTSLGIQNDNCYIRIEDPSFLHTYISNLLEADQINLPLKFLFDQLLEHLIKIYRIITVEGAHLLLLCHNSTTAKYLIELACQVGQNDYFQLKGKQISVQKHIQPTLYYKDNVCLTEDIDHLSTDSIYQIACLLNYNVYDYGLKGDLRQKVKLNLNKKEKVQVEKKESKTHSKIKTEQIKLQQKEEDIQTLMAQQFMNYAHFVFQAKPTSEKLKTFISKENDIVGQLQFKWIDIPQESILKVAKQILSFDQETNQLILESHNNDRLIEKVRIIYDNNSLENRYFNDILIVSQLVKSENVRLSAPLLQRQKDIKQAKQIYIKVTQQIKEKQEKMKCLQEEIEEVNGHLEQKCKELQEINNKITQWQMSTNSEENNNSEGLSQLRVQREEIEIQLKLIKEKKEQLQPQKKKILKNIKIANDYLQIFENSLESFGKKVQHIQEKLSLLQDKLIIVWSLVSYLIKRPVSEWIVKANHWIQLISSKLPQLASEQSLLELVEEVCPFIVSRSQLFCNSLRIKLQTLFLLLNSYEESAFYGKILRIHDPKGILPFVLENLLTEETASYNLLKSFPIASRQVRGEIQTLCKMKNGIIVIENEKDIQQLELSLTEKKMSSYLNKILVISSEKSAHFSLQCEDDQLLLSIQNLILKEINASLFQQKLISSQEIVTQRKKKKENEELFYRASSSINIETQTYTEELNKYKNVLEIIQQNLANLSVQNKAKKYLEFPEFEMLDYIYQTLRSVWNRSEITIKHILFVYHQSIYIRNYSDYEQLSLEQKDKILQKIVSVNLSEENQSLQNHVKFTKKWDNKVKLYTIQPCKKTLEAVQGNKQYKLINFLTTNNIIPHINQSSSHLKILYNFIPSLHLSMLNQAIDILLNDTSERIVPLIIMTELSHLKDLQQTKVKMIPIELDIQLPEETQREIKNQWVQNLKKYLINLTKNSQHVNLVLPFIEKCTDLTKNQDQLTKLLSDILPLQSNTIMNLLNMPNEDVSAYIYSQSLANEQKQRRGTEVSKNCQEIGSIKQELPFIFNIAQFMPSKDPIAAEFISQCIQFNKKLKEVKERLKEPQYQWEDIQRVIPSNKFIQSLNNQYQILRKNFIKLHLLPNNNASSNAKSASHKTFSSGNIIFHNVMRLPHNMLNPKILNLLKCKAAKKFKNKLSNIYLEWKICTQSFSFEENCSYAQLSTVAQGRLMNGKVLQSTWSSGLQTLKKIQLIAYAIESPQEPKQNPQSHYLPIRNGSNILGHLQIPKGQLSSEYITGLESPEIVIEDSY